jgi:hypothetical protein
MGDGLIACHKLPRAKGAFARGCVDRFTLFCEDGDLGDIKGVRVWHEPDGTSIGGGWCLDKLELEDKFKGRCLFSRSEKRH